MLSRSIVIKEEAMTGFREQQTEHISSHIPYQVKIATVKLLKGVNHMNQWFSSLYIISSRISRKHPHRIHCPQNIALYLCCWNVATYKWNVHNLYKLITLSQMEI